MVSTGDVTKGTSQRHKEVILRVAGQLVPPLIESLSPNGGILTCFAPGVFSVVGGILGKFVEVCGPKDRSQQHRQFARHFAKGRAEGPLWTG